MLSYYLHKTDFFFVAKEHDAPSYKCNQYNKGSATLYMLWGVVWSTINPILDSMVPEDGAANSSPRHQQA